MLLLTGGGIEQKLESVSGRNDRKKIENQPRPCRLLLAGASLPDGCSQVLCFLFTEKHEAENAEENEEPFVAPLGLSVPPDVELVRVCLPHVRSSPLVFTAASVGARAALYLCEGTRCRRVN